MVKLLLSLVIKFVEAHPEAIVDLFDEALKAGTNALKAHNATSK